MIRTCLDLQNTKTKSSEPNEQSVRKIRFLKILLITSGLFGKRITKGKYNVRGERKLINYS